MVDEVIHKITKYVDGSMGYQVRIPLDEWVGLGRKNYHIKLFQALQEVVDANKDFYILKINIHVKSPEKPKSLNIVVVGCLIKDGD
jgi:hypothetical protein